MLIIIIKNKNTVIFLDTFVIGLVAYSVTIAILWYIEKRKKRKKTVSVLTRLIYSLRAGDKHTSSFFRKHIKFNKAYLVQDLKIYRFIREITNTEDSDEILVIDLGTFSYALKNYQNYQLNVRSAYARIQVKNISLVIINLSKTIFTVLLSSAMGTFTFVFLGLKTAICTILLLLIFQFNFRCPYNASIIQECHEISTTPSIFMDSKLPPIVVNPSQSKLNIEELIPIDQEFQMEKTVEDATIVNRKYRANPKPKIRYKTLQDLKKEISYDQYVDSYETEYSYNQQRIMESERLRIRND